MAELAYEHVGTEMSAFIDGEVDGRTATHIQAHLDVCGVCRRQEAALRGVKRAVRLQPAPPVPDLRSKVMERIALEAPLLGRRRERHRLLRIAATAAVVTVLFLAGGTELWRDRAPQVAGAGEISTLVQNAARSLESYRATYEIEERGWHPRVDVRRLVAEVWFDAPERFRLRTRDLTAYPDDSWPANDVDIVATARRWSIREPSICPVEALPVCGTPGQMERRTLTQRQPFDGTTALPTDIVLPLQTLATSDRFSVLGETRVSGRAAYRLGLAYSDARPLVDTLQAGGSWRRFSPEATVQLWIDRATWFPLRFSVTEPGSETAGLTVRATSFAKSDLPDSLFRVPVKGIVKSGGFRAGDGARPPYAPSYTAGLPTYRNGRTDTGSLVLSYARGMNWLKVTFSRGGAASTRPELSERIRMDRGVAYYRPADSSLRRSLDLFGRSRRLHIETNMAREELLKVAGSTGFVGHEADYPPGVENASLRAIGEIHRAQLPAYLPIGYEKSAAYTTSGPRGVTGAYVYFRRPEVEYDGIGIRLTQIFGVSELPPSSETFESVRIGRLDARWSAERGELEWVDDRVYRAIAAPSLGRAEAELMARSLR
ncbi:MAG: zf-HC2 domain-containing protein [Actinomycetota bacterium]